MGAASEDDRAHLQFLQAELAGQRQNLDHLSDEEIQELTTVIVANEVSLVLEEAELEELARAAGARWLLRSSGDEQSCFALAREYPGVFTRAIASSGVLAWSFFPPNPLLTIAGGAALYLTIKKAGETIDKIIDACLRPFGDLILELDVRSSSRSLPAMRMMTMTAAPLNLEHGISSSFRVPALTT